MLCCVMCVCARRRIWMGVCADNIVCNLWLTIQEKTVVGSFISQHALPNKLLLL